MLPDPKTVQMRVRARGAQRCSANNTSARERPFRIGDQFRSGSPESEYRMGRIEGARQCAGSAPQEAVSRSSVISAADSTATGTRSVGACAPSSRCVRAGAQGSAAQPVSWLHAATDVQGLHSCRNTPPKQRAGIMKTAQAAAIDMATRLNIDERILRSTIMSSRWREGRTSNADQQPFVWLHLVNS